MLILFTLTFFPQMVEKGANLLKRMEISVAEAEKRTGKNAVSMQETYTVYLIETRYVNSTIHLSSLQILPRFHKWRCSDFAEIIYGYSTLVRLSSAVQLSTHRHVLLVRNSVGQRFLYFIPFLFLHSKMLYVENQDAPLFTLLPSQQFE